MPSASAQTNARAPSSASTQTSTNTSPRPRAGTPSSADTALAEKYAALAFEAYSRKAYAEAVGLYERGLAVAPSADILYNIARIYDLGLRHRALAMDYYRRYVDDPGAVPSRILIANQRLAELRAAEQAATLDVEPPAHTRASADLVGAQKATGPSSQMSAQRGPVSPSHATAAPAEPLPSRAARTSPRTGVTPLEITALTLGGVGLASVGIGVGFGIAARAQTDTWRQYCDGNACTSQRGVDAAESAERSARVATIGFATGGTLLALSTVVWWLGEAGKSTDAAAALEVSPVASESELGWTFSGSF
jgi:tetratricopeptide (TPR) repeat protein